MSDLLARGVLTADGSGGQWLHDYCAHLREIAAGRATNGDLDLAGERARLAKEQADKVAMQNAVTRGELAPVGLIEEVLAKAGARAAKILDTIPGTIRRREPSLSADTIATIARDIAKVRNIAASVSLADLREDDQADDQGRDQQSDAPFEEA
ncbi:terminase small subunit [Aromatoleum aromaticum]|uniref:terminase small subunit n=1 Tax=Aromatoleum aromaticum TaxID=551760 RepID=UPI001B7CDCEA|nr:terminase small subunit [Aromatoleum aromaticum]